MVAGGAKLHRVLCAVKLPRLRLSQPAGALPPPRPVPPPPQPLFLSRFYHLLERLKWLWMAMVISRWHVVTLQPQYRGNLIGAGQDQRIEPSVPTLSLSDQVSNLCRRHRREFRWRTPLRRTPPPSAAHTAADVGAARIKREPRGFSVDDEPETEARRKTGPRCRQKALIMQIKCDSECQKAG